MPAPVASGWSESPGGPCTHWERRRLVTAHVGFRTFAGTCSGDKVAPFPAIRGTEIERQGSTQSRPSRPPPEVPPLCRLLVLPQRHRHFVTAEAVTAVAAVTTPKLQLVSKGSVRRRSVPASQHRGAVGANPRKPCNRWGRRAATGRKPARRVEGRGHVAQRTSANHFDTDSRSSASTGEHWRDNRINLNGHTRRS